MRTVTFVFLCFCLLACCSQPDKEATVAIEHEWSSKNSISIENPHDFPVQFTLKINDLFPVSEDDILNEVSKSSSAKKRGPVKASWLYVSENTFHSDPLSVERWQHDPFLFLNSIGGGYCDDRASVLHEIWKMQGLKSRVICLEGHVVPEVYADGRWQMYDPDYKVFYCDAKGQVKSIKQLENSRADLLSACAEASLNPVFAKSNPVSTQISDFYLSKSDNREVTDWKASHPRILSDFTIPAHSSLEILFDPETGITNIRVKLNTRSSGKIRLPLVPYSASGGFSISTEDTIMQVSGNFTFPVNRLMHEMNIEKVDKASVVEFLVNPSLSFMKQQNKLQVHSRHSLTIQNITNHTKPRILLGERDFFFQQKENQYRDFISEISEYRNEAIDKDFLRNKYRRFMLEDQKIQSKQREDWIRRFESDLEKLDFNAENQELLRKYYPTSVFKVLVASRYRRMDYLEDFMHKIE